jgi:hypothetical protein
MISDLRPPTSDLCLKLQPRGCQFNQAERLRASCPANQKSELINHKSSSPLHGVCPISSRRTAGRLPLETLWLPAISRVARTLMGGMPIWSVSCMDAEGGGKKPHAMP